MIKNILKPCPFCGSNKICLHEEESIISRTGTMRNYYCDECSAAGGYSCNINIAREKWNKRDHGEINYFYKILEIDGTSLSAIPREVGYVCAKTEEEAIKIHRKKYPEIYNSWNSYEAIKLNFSKKEVEVEE